MESNAVPFKTYSDNSQFLLKDKSDFVNRMNHDIRIPLNSILGMTTLAQDALDNPQKISNCLSKIELSAKHLLTLMNDLIDMSKIELNTFELSEQTFNLEHIIHTISNLVFEEALNKFIDFQVIRDNIPDKDFIGDCVHLKQLILKILHYCITYTCPNGKIVFKIGSTNINEKEANICFSISDNGIGMSDEIKEIFLAPFSNSNIKPSDDVELLLIKNILKAMNGTMTIESRLGIGSTFNITIPLKFSDNSLFSIEEYAVEESSFNKSHLNTKKYDFNKKNILIVEDNELNAETVSEILKISNAQTSIAPNGKVAFEMVCDTKSKYDLILMDIQMPVMNGYEATVKIRNSSIPNAKTIPIIAMTADTFSSDISKALSVGMNAHMAKPVHVSTLYKTVHNMLSI